jgi:hypothetical protein
MKGVSLDLIMTHQDLTFVPFKWLNLTIISPLNYLEPVLQFIPMCYDEIQTCPPDKSVEIIFISSPQI